MAKTVIEFGIRGGAYCETMILPSMKAAQKLAVNLVNVFSNDPTKGNFEDWQLRADKPRIGWQSSTHFVSISILDGVMRGPASSTLWKKEG